MNKIKQKGFTLVELIVVLAILATLAAIMVPSLTGYIDKAKDTELISIVKSIHTAAQIEASETYARGPYVIDGENMKPASGNFMSIKNIVGNSELKDWGYPGEDYCNIVKPCGHNTIINGFGYDKHNDAKYHFKVLVSLNGKVAELAVCSGDKVAILKNGNIIVSDNKCRNENQHNTGELYNYVVIDYDLSCRERYNYLITTS